ncbi:STAS domain-containing protein [Streptomyces sp. NPDC004237]|uniref:STAS domain-containing protein n=1 Tax=Streptomyces sp. NPDC004237 TaxID=3154455 RepID=UPI0033BE2576
MLIRDEVEREELGKSSLAETAAGSEDARSSQVGHSHSGPPEVVQYELHGTQVFAAHGEYDPASITLLANALRSAAEKYPRVVVDTTAVSFADSTFLNLLLNIHHTTDLRVVAPPAQLRRLLEVTGADTVLKVLADLEDATS